MDLADIAARLAELHENPGFRVYRFDRGPEFEGRVAVLPSAFNPPTRAHLRLIELAGTVEGVRGVAALLSTNNVDKSIFGAPLAHRIDMLLHATEEQDWPAILGSNAARISDQAHALRAQWPGVEFDMVVGYDTLIRLFDPRYYEDMPGSLDRFFEHHRLIATNRSEAGIETVLEFIEEPACRNYASRIVPLRLDDEHAALSSTQAREDAAEDRPSEALTPEVGRYIRRHGLYGDSD